MASGEKGMIFNEDLESELDSSEKRSLTWRSDPLASDKLGPSSTLSHQGKLPSKQVLVNERDKEEWRSMRYHLLSMDAYSRHKTLVNRYLLTVGRGIEHVQRATDRDRTDYDVLKDHHRFLWDDGTDAGSWENRLAKSYYDKLFKEYALSDLSKYKENKIALRWRTEKEVVDGKGQFVCGNKVCPVAEGLESWEVNFAYLEQGERKNALVKLRLCSKCSKKLNYHHQNKKWKKHEKKQKRKKDPKHSRRKRRKKDPDNSGSSSSSNSEGSIHYVIIKYKPFSTIIVCY